MELYGLQLRENTVYKVQMIKLDNVEVIVSEDVKDKYIISVLLLQN